MCAACSGNETKHPAAASTDATARAGRECVARRVIGPDRSPSAPWQRSHPGDLPFATILSMRDARDRGDLIDEATTFQRIAFDPSPTESVRFTLVVVEGPDVGQSFVLDPLQCSF